MKYRNRVAALLLCILLLCGLHTTTVSALTQDENRKGTITVAMKYGGEAISGGTLTVYRVGEATEENGKYKFHKSEAIQDFAVDFDLDDSGINDPDLADAIAAFVEENHLSAYADAENQAGKAVFTDLDVGMYLIMQTKTADGYEPLKPFLVAVPMNEDGQYKWAVIAEGKTQDNQNAIPPVPSVPGESDQPTVPNVSENISANTTDETLPQTGQLNWPVPMLAALGLLLFSVGWLLYFSGKKEHYAA